jgi:hypothetical protein
MNTAAPMSIRVQLAEAWDAVRIDVEGEDSVGAVKLRALETLDPTAGFPDDYAITYRGVKLWDESASLAAAGVVSGATLLIERRRRRAVR